MAYILPPPSPMSLLFLHSKFDFFLTPPPFLDNVTNFTKTQKLKPRKNKGPPNTFEGSFCSYFTYFDDKLLLLILLK